ncbi:transferrin-binding protein-like solute binding protein [Pseudoroseicyclus tamaricis]|uniref:Transferrin-binding protein-like solute binding protein n=1 Tax=Pseudoroseicyclus tamaricis TaxID=2705421 RepID=A0A6B2JJM3_9RHOB|nr:transferrin-binding protein-like solute binding protein [Pseudoroseicyclus tamaricis]NDV01643.1 transferrin-binding protein-like solute binding protein [Pseudoroseicyclus tamaricis]
MQKHIIVVLSVGLFGTLSACSSGSSGASEPRFETYDEWSAFNDDLGDRVGESDSVFIEDLPTSGTADYEGYFFIRHYETDGNRYVGGDVGLDVDFADQSLTGEAGNFIDDEDRQIAGTVMIAGQGFISDPYFLDTHVVTDLNGTLASPLGHELAIDEAVEAYFTEDDEGSILSSISEMTGTSLYTGETVEMDLVFVTGEQ